MTSNEMPNLPADDTSSAPNSPNPPNPPNDLPESYELETLEQLRAIADELRSRIVEALIHKPMTVTQLGEMLGQAPAKIHYHVRELERVGLIRLVATREKSGILEKYYRAIARSLTASKTLLSHVPSDETLATMRSFLDNATRGFLRAAEYTMRNQQWENPKVWGLNATQIWITYDEMKEMARRVQAEFDKYAAPRGIDGEEERTVVMMGYDPRVAEATATAPEMPPLPDLPSTPGAPRPTVPPVPPAPGMASSPRAGSRQPRLHRIVSAGVTSFSSAQLEEAIAQNRRLDISVIGVCVFTSDVTPDLVDRAIAHFRHRGILTASPEVREALKRKE